MVIAGRPDPEQINDREQFAQALTWHREHRGRSVRELAAATGGASATLGGYLSGRHLPTAAQSELFRLMLLACGIPEHELAGWMEALRRVRRTPARRSGAAQAPYRGMVSFQVQDAPWFCGRERVTAELLHETTRGGLIAVVGASGAGKSSLLRAGLIAAWEHGAAAERGPALLVTPGEDPTARLRAELGITAGAQPAAVPGSPGSPGLLVVDQLEELFTLVGDEDERLSFLTLLADLAESSGLPVVVGLRADFYAAASRYEALLPSLRHRQILVGPMDRDELRRAVLEPARRAGLAVDERLVDMLLQEVAPGPGAGRRSDPGTLPLLSHALLGTWTRSRRGRLTLEDYLATGGIRGAVAQTAEQVYAALRDDQQEATRRVLLQMVTIGAAAVPTRRSLPLSDVPPESEVAAVLDRFTMARLVTVSDEGYSLSHEALLSAWPRLAGWVEADQAALLQLRELRELAAYWERSGRDDAALLHGGRLAAVEQWLAEVAALSVGRDESVFVERSRQRERWRATESRRRSRRLRQLLAVTVLLALLAGAGAVLALLSRAQAVADRSMAQAAAATALSRQLAGSASRLRATDPALSAQLALVAFRTAPTVEARSALLDTTATAIPAVVNGAAGPTFVAAVPGSDVYAVTDDQHGTVTLYSRAAGGPVALATVRARTATQELFSVAVSPDGALLAAGGTAGAVDVWNIRDPARPTRPVQALPAMAGGVLSVAFSPDSRQLAAVGAAGAVLRWRTSDWAAMAPLLESSAPTPDLEAVTYSRDGRYLAVGGAGGTVTLYPAGTPAAGGGQPARPLARITTQGRNRIDALAFDPAGGRLVAGTQTGQLVVYDLATTGTATPAARQPAPCGARVNALAFSADGHRLAVASSDSAASVLSTADWSVTSTFPHTSPVTGAAFLAGGNDLVTTSSNGGTRIYPLPGPSLGPFAAGTFYLDWSKDSTTVLAGPGRAENAVSGWNVTDRDHPRQVFRITGSATDPIVGTSALSPDGATVVAALASGPEVLYRILDHARATRVGLLPGPRLRQEAVTFDRGGRMVASGGDDSTLWLFDVRDPVAPRLLAAVPKLGGQVFGLAFSPDDRWLSVGLTDHTARWFDVADPAHPRQVAVLRGMRNYAYATSVSPSGSLLAVGGADHSVLLWDLADPAAPRQRGPRLTGPTNEVEWVDFSPDSTLLAAAGNDGVVWVWNVADPDHPVVLDQLAAAAEAVTVVGFSPDGTSIAAGSTDRRIHLWATDPAAAARQVCARAGADISADQWAVYLPDQPYRPPCG